MLYLNYRVSGALGLPTVRIFGESYEEIQKTAYSMQLEFMPCDSMADGWTKIFIKD